jgi:hypothetical protein
MSRVGSNPRLKKASFEEAVARGKATHAEWGSPLSPEQFLERERAHKSQAWAKENLASWALIDESGRCLSSCESFRVESDFRGQKGLTFGIGSVFTGPSLRGRGYARIMLEQLERELAARERGLQAFYLFSDIDTNYYTKLGYEAVPAWDHIYPAQSGDPLEGVTPLEVSAAYELAQPRSPFLLRASPGFLDWHFERSRVVSRLLARPYPSIQAIWAGRSTMIWHVNYKYDELTSLVFESDNIAEAELLVRAAQRTAGSLGVKNFRAWEERANFPWPSGGKREARDGAIPMLKPVAPGLSALDWAWVSRAVWI